MTQTPTFPIAPWLAVAIVAALPLASLAQASNANPPTTEQAGIVKSVRGDVLLQGLAGTSRLATAGDPFAPSERIVTGSNSGASLVLRDGTALVVGPSSRLDLKSFSFDATTHSGNMLVTLFKGSMRMVTGLIGRLQPDAVQISTRTATVGIRGTDFIVEADE